MKKKSKIVLLLMVILLVSMPVSVYAKPKEGSESTVTSQLTGWYPDELENTVNLEFQFADNQKSNKGGDKVINYTLDTECGQRTLIFEYNSANGKVETKMLDENGHMIYRNNDGKDVNKDGITNVNVHIPFDLIAKNPASGYEIILTPDGTGKKDTIQLTTAETVPSVTYGVAFIGLIVFTLYRFKKGEKKICS